MNAVASRSAPSIPAGCALSFPPVCTGPAGKETAPCTSTCSEGVAIYEGRALSVIADRASESRSGVWSWEGGPEGGAPRSNEELGAEAGSGADEAAQKEAFDELFRRLWRASVEWSRAAGAREQDTAEDAATQAWFRAWRYRHRYDQDRAAYATWLGTIVRNETMDLLRSESRLPRTGDAIVEEVADPRTFEEPHLLALSFVWEAFEQLRCARPEFAAALRLKALGYRDRQIADFLGLERVGTVGSRLNRAKRFLAERLAERGIVYLSDEAGATAVCHGLTPLCGTGGGGFYSIVPDSGLLLLPQGQTPGGSLALVEQGFFVSVWLRRKDPDAGLTGWQSCAG